MSIQSIVNALNGRMSGSYGMACCPVHTDKTPSLKIWEVNGEIRFYCFGGCPWQEVKDSVRSRGLLPQYDGTRSEAPVETGSERRAREERAARAKADQLRWIHKIWNETEPVQDTPVSVYLSSRGITGYPSTIRYHRALKHTNTGQYFGCMVAAITHWPDRNIIGIHRTFLQPGGRGKANITSAKKMAGSCKGAAVRLSPVTDRLALAEGIETGLSVQQSTKIPTWACLSTSGLRGVIIPDTVKEILIFSDGDEPGEKAACDAARRFIEHGKKTKIIRAPDGQDFNDVLKESANG